MANVLSTDKQIAIVGALCEGTSIRSIERITGVHRDTIMRLGWPSAPLSFKSSGTMNQQKPGKIGRPRLPKSDAKGRIVPVRFNSDTLKRITALAKANKQTVSEWIRSTLNAAIQ
jgi:hypothetical protein